MARIRDYAAEYKARNQRAKEMGFASYGALRKAGRTGKIAYDKLNKEYVRTTNTRQPKYKREGFDSPEAYMQAIAADKLIAERDIKLVQDWQNKHSHTPKSFLNEKDIQNPELREAFMKAYVNKNNRNRAMDIHDYLVIATGFMTEAQYKAYKKRK